MDATVNLVLGGEGLIGKALCSYLEGIEQQCISLDLRSGVDLRKANKDPFEKCDRVWFLAWDVGGYKYLSQADKQHVIFKNNCELCVSVFEMLYRTRKPFIFTSSQLAIQSSAYGLTKLMAEQWTKELGGKICRLWNVYGWEEPGIRSHVIPDLVLTGLKEGQIYCSTRGTERRQFVHCLDCVRALVIFADSEQSYADITSGEWRSIKEVAIEVADQLGVKVTFGEKDGYEHIVEPILPLKAWSPNITLSEGINRVIHEARRWLYYWKKSNTIS